jgi:hypothetical protein
MPTRGPVPKRSTQRRRVNKPEVAVVTATAGARPVQPPTVEGWHPMAAAWYESLGRSGQCRFYEASDWAQAVIAAEIVSRLLHAGRVSAPLLAAWLSMSTGLLTSEGDRRRMRIELERGEVDENAERADAVVTDIAARLHGA